MKRLASILLAAALLINCAVFADFSAYASTRKNAPERKVGDSFTITLKIENENGGSSTDWNHAYYAKFKPEADGDYEFAVKGEDFYGEGGYCALITDAKDNVVSYAYALGEDSFQIDLVGHLKANRTYYYLVQYSADVDHTVNLKVKLKKHKHQMINTGEGIPDAEYMIDAVDEDGKPFDMCKVQGCYSSGIGAYYGVYYIEASKQKYLYDGKEKTPKPVFYDRRGKAFDADDKDLKVKFENNVVVGKAKMNVRYNGLWHAIKFTILPAKTKIEKLTSKKRKVVLKWDIVKAQASGYQVEYSRDKSFKKGSAKRVKVSGRKSSSLNINNLSSGRKYYFRVRTYKKVGKKTYYSPWSAAESVKVR